MNSFEIAQDEYEADTGELESDSFQFESDHEYDSEADMEIESPLDEVEEMELAADLLNVSSEEEMDQFLGKLFKGIGKGLRKFGKFVGKSVFRPLGGLLKGIAKKALPFIGGALGSFIPIPGVGTAIGTAVGGAASKLLEVDLEGMSPEDQEFELARRFVRLASQAAARASDASGLDDEMTSGAAAKAALGAVQQAASQLSSYRGGPRRRQQSGNWMRQGNKIVVLGA